VKLYTFEQGGRERIGAERDGRLVDLTSAYPGDLLRFIRDGESAAMSAARDAVAFSALTFGFDEVRLRTPLPRPGKILCSGVNYRGHLKENPAAKLPEEPFFFAKLPSAMIGPGDSIVLPRGSAQVDAEVELAVVIGRRMRHTPASEVMAGIFGYTILHDVSARDVQFRDQQITLGKNFDTFAPIGPCIVTKEEISEPDNVRLRATISGETLQDGTTRDWIFPLPELIAALARVMTLEPGDIVSTGTPAGVGYFRCPQRFLRPGDTCVLEIDGIGRLENPVLAEAGGS
jgi:2-keto-4-pentenoate hydratase/2-oxohepta-3-ene-1,7-dioic acid hydratase in catechol pathway